MAAINALLEVRNVTKTFDRVVRALDNVSIEVKRNEIISVVGENGAGKSTLMKIMVGVYKPDYGKMYYMGREVAFPENPLDALRRGISIVYQEKGVIPHLKVYQFLFLGLEDKFTRLGRLQLEKIIGLAKSVFEELGVKCDLASSMYELSLSTQKMVEIARAILSIKLMVGEESKITPIIILDEPTAPLSLEERDELFDYLVNLRASNSFIFVSHIIPEVIKFSDRIYVLRDGRLVAHHDVRAEKVSEEELFREIVGRESYHELWARYESVKVRDVDKRPIVLSVRKIKKKGYYEGISFDLHEGECIGLFGPAGCGKSEIARSLYGDIMADEGEIIVDGRKLKIKGEPHTRVRAGIGYFSGETGKELLLFWPIKKNLSIVNFDKVTRSPFKIVSVISFKAEKILAERIMNKLRIKAPSVEAECYSLSGGNKQKVSVGKWLEKAPRILILEDPTIGIDVGAREDIYEALIEMKKNGISMILVSDDPKEYALLCDKIIFIKDGMMQAVYTNEEFRKVMEL